jgi:5-methylcytosine-specific restriction endonuclease McrA
LRCSLHCVPSTKACRHNQMVLVVGYGPVVDPRWPASCCSRRDGSNISSQELMIPKPERTRLNKDEYNALRLRIFEKQGWRCALCFRLKPLQLDHIVKRSQLGSDSEENCRGLCAECHDKEDNTIYSKKSGKKGLYK